MKIIEALKNKDLEIKYKDKILHYEDGAWIVESRKKSIIYLETINVITSDEEHAILILLEES